MKVSFSEFILRYLDDWNLEAQYLAEDLYVARHTLDAWLYRRRIPNSDNIKMLENYFGEDFEGVVFDGKEFRRRYKVIRADGISKVYDTMAKLSKVEGVAIETITRSFRDDKVIKQGRSKGYRFERFYMEVE